MSRRPLIAFLAGLAPYPPPLIGSSLRISRLVRELHEEFDIALLCLADVDTTAIVENWELGRRLTRVVAIPRPEPLGRRDAIWGSIPACARATLITSLPGQRPRMFDWGWSDKLVESTRQALSELKIEAVWATRIWCAEMARAAGARRIIVDVDDFQGDAMMRELAEGPPYKRKLLHRIQAKNLVPNGVDFPPLIDRSRVSPAELLFVGTLSWFPNIEAMQQLAEEILPAIQSAFPAANLTVAGRAPTPDSVRSLLSRPAVELHESPVSLAEYYSRATIAVAPLLRGGGTSIKVLESLAYAVPTVVSPAAARGLGLEDGKHLLIASSTREFADACIHLLNDPGKARALAEAGRQEVLRRFSWQAAGARARAAVHSVLESRESVA